MSAEVHGAIEKLWRRVQLFAGIGRIKTGSDAGLVQTQQVQLGALEVIDNLPRMAEYGFTSMPRPGCQAVVIFIGGDRSNGAIVATNDQAARLRDLKPGEVAIYDHLGQSVWLKTSGIEIDGAGLPIRISNVPTATVKADTRITLDAPDVETTGKLTVAGLLTYQGGLSGGGGSGASMQGPLSVQGGEVTHNGKSIGDTHAHGEVMKGSDTSGGPI